MGNQTKIVNAMTVDVEDYFQVSAFEKNVSVTDWDNIEPRVDTNTRKLLDIFERHNTKVTFFMLGWVAECFPDLVKAMSAAGHEVASHGYWHRRATEQTQEGFKEDVDRTRKLLQDLSGQPINGYRAPSFSFNDSNEWAYEVLAEAGYKYSSSIYPVKHDLYGMPDAPRFKYQTPQGIWEVPLSTLKIASKNIPISGGGYFRLYPYKFTSWAINRYHKMEKQPYIFYMHPWEIDQNQPRMKSISAKTRFRHYLNLSRVETRINHLLKEFKWDSMEAVYFKSDNNGF